MSDGRSSRISGRPIASGVAGDVMSWIEKELKKRAARKARATDPASRTHGDPEDRRDTTRILALWDRFLEANNALPTELKLRREADSMLNSLTDGPSFILWLVAENDAALGFNGEGIRYIWPKVGRRRSNNFWIRWSADKGYFLRQRVEGPSSSTDSRDRRFNEARIDHMLKCLVTGVRVKPRSVSARRLWFF
jgi:hypothetical protein